MSSDIHPSAYIEPGASLGEGVSIGPHVVVYRNVTLGDHVQVHAGAVLGDTPQDFAFQGAESRVVVGARTVIREHVTINRGTKDGTQTVVGEGCFLMAGSHLGHNVRLGHRVILANGVLLGGYVEVDDGAFLSGHVSVHQFCRIGRLAMVSGLGAISQDVPPFFVTRGGSLNTVVGVNMVGLRRAGFTPAQRAEVRRAFKLLYRSGLNTSQALAAMRTQLGEPLPLEIAEFVAASKRGICGGSRASAGEAE